MWEYGYGHPMMWGGAGYGSGFVGILFNVLWVFVLIVAIAALVRLVRGSHGRHWCRHWMGGDGALDILKERYAKGEIDKAEFEAKKKDLA